MSSNFRKKNLYISFLSFYFYRINEESYNCLKQSFSATFCTITHFVLCMEYRSRSTWVMHVETHCIVLVV